MSNSDLEPRLTRVEVDMVELKQRMSDLISTVSTLADIVSTHETALEASERQANADRALMMSLIQAIAQGGNGSSQADG